MKRCFRCGQVKPYGEFYKNRARRDGYSGECKDCTKAKVRGWVAVNRDKRVAYEKAYRAANREAIRAREKTYRTVNRDAKIAYSRAYWSAHRKDLNAKRQMRRDPESEWERALWRKHALRPWEWQAMWDAQDGLCYLGQHPLAEDRSKIAVDHDHDCCPENRSCGACRRGLACAKCNTAIGLLRDDPQLIRLAADNLERQRAIVRARIAAQPRAEALF